jgi:hypothetical protein
MTLALLRIAERGASERPPVRCRLPAVHRCAARAWPGAGRQRRRNPQAWAARQRQRECRQIFSPGDAAKAAESGRVNNAAVQSAAPAFWAPVQRVTIHYLYEEPVTRAFGHRQRTARPCPSRRARQRRTEARQVVYKALSISTWATSTGVQHGLGRKRCSTGRRRPVGADG